MSNICESEGRPQRTATTRAVAIRAEPGRILPPARGTAARGGNPTDRCSGVGMRVHSEAPTLAQEVGRGRCHPRRLADGARRHGRQHAGPGSRLCGSRRCWSTCECGGCLICALFDEYKLKTMRNCRRQTNWLLPKVSMNNILIIYLLITLLTNSTASLYSVVPARGC